MNFTDIIDISSNEQKDNLLSFMHTKFSDEHQRMFVKSFYMTLFESEDKYPINDEEAIKWLGFTRKNNFIKMLEKHLIIDKDYKKVLLKLEQNPLGGRPTENYKLSVNAFKILGMKAGTKEGDNIRMYYIELEKQIFTYGMYQSSEKLKNQIIKTENLLIENEKLNNENKLLNVTNGNAIIYIYNTDTRPDISRPALKIGVTEKLRERTKPYKQTHPWGQIVFKVEIPNESISSSYKLNTIEHFIHLMLKSFKIANEMFDIDISEAKIIITRIINSIEIMNIHDSTQRQLILQKLIDNETVIIKNIPNPKLSVNNISTQTDFSQEFKQLDINIIISKFDEYIQTCCILEDEAEISTVDIIGQYRLWTKSADKETYHSLMDYLIKKFKPIRLALQNKDQIVNGFKGLKLKEIEYKQSIISSDPETFIFSVCKFSSNGKVLMSEILSEYSLWKKRVNKNIIEEDNKILKTYLKNCNHVFISNLWTSKGNGQGYYGISLKSDDNFHRKMSSTSKKVEKRDYESHTILDSWLTISKAAESEGISSAKMSRSIKNKLQFNNYYYCINNIQINQ